MTVDLRPRLFDVDEYYKMGDAGILRKDDRVELIRGRILETHSRCGREPGAYHMFTVHDFERMAEVGILSEDDRVELLEGEILEMAPIGSRHSACVEKLNWLLSQKVDLQQVFVRVQDAVRLDPESQPQPDIVLARFRDDFYKLRHPGPDEIFLLIEVADSSLAYDREVKIGRYALSRVPEVWIVDLLAQTIETYREPAGDHYAVHNVLHKGNLLNPSLLPAVLLSVEDILI
jgi:Uma2 family endonuclease